MRNAQVRTLHVNKRLEDTDDGRRLGDLLTRLRRGNMTPQDFDDLNARALGQAGMPAELTGPRGFDVVPSVITPRHEVICSVVEQLVRAGASAARQQLIRWRARDMRVGGCRAQFLCDKAQPVGLFYVGMPVVAVCTLNAKLGVVNNCAMECVALCLDNAEPPIDPAAPLVDLQFLPQCVFVRVRAAESFFHPAWPHERNVVPLRPMKLPMRTGITRCTIPYVPACAVTDIGAQGRTNRPDERVVIDLRRPPTGRLSFNAIYVMLSRYTAWRFVTLLCPLYTPEMRDVELPQLMLCALPRRDIVAAAWLLENPGSDYRSLELGAVLDTYDVRATALAGAAARARRAAAVARVTAP